MVYGPAGLRQCGRPTDADSWELRTLNRPDLACRSAREQKQPAGQLSEQKSACRSGFKQKYPAGQPSQQRTGQNSRNGFWSVCRGQSGWQALSCLARLSCLAGQISGKPRIALGSLPGTWLATGQGPCLVSLSSGRDRQLADPTGQDSCLARVPCRDSCVVWSAGQGSLQQQLSCLVSWPGFPVGTAVLSSPAGPYSTVLATDAWGTARAYGLAVPRSNGHWPAAIAILANGFR